MQRLLVRTPRNQTRRQELISLVAFITSSATLFGIDGGLRFGVSDHSARVGTTIGLVLASACEVSLGKGGQPPLDGYGKSSTLTRFGMPVALSNKLDGLFALLHSTAT
jgi:hypothetical protein